MEKNTVNFVVKRVGDDVSARTIDFVITTATLDRDGDTIDPAGWDLANYLKNPVVLWGHDSWSPPIGKCTELRITPTGLQAKAQFATKDENPLADTVYKLLLGGFLNSVSVGFRSTRREYTDTGVAYKAQELLEFSVVSIPSNPDALALARGKQIDLSPLADTYRQASEGETGTRKGVAALCYLEASKGPHTQVVRNADGITVGHVRGGVLALDPAFEDVLRSKNLAAVREQQTLFSKRNARIMAVKGRERALRLAAS